MIVDLNDENYTYDKFIADSNKLADQYNNLYKMSRLVLLMTIVTFFC